MKRYPCTLISALCLLATLIPPARAQTPAAAKARAMANRAHLEQLLAKRLPRLGHRNWIAVVDSAYPLQTSPGIDTETVRVTQLEAVRMVLHAIERAPHVRPVIYTDAELPYVAESDAPGITAYRRQLGRILHGQDVHPQLHDTTIAKLNEAGKTFNILIIKTPLTLAYTSVFFQLQCGYWTDAAEARLRNAMRKAGTKH